MPKRKGNSIYFFILLINIILFISPQEYNYLYNFPFEIIGQDYLPMIPIYFKDYSLIPKLMLIDINIDKSWFFDIYSYDNNENNENNNKEIINHDFYSVLGYKKREKIYLNSVIKIDDFYYLNINQVKEPNYYSGVLSLNKNLSEYNIMNKFKYVDSTIIKNKYFGFCLNFNYRDKKEGKLSIGNMRQVNNHILNLIRLPLYEEENENKDDIKNLKWAVRLYGLFIGSINITSNEKDNIDEKKTIYKINRKNNKGLIIDESANIETIYNSIYVTKEVMLFLSANYFNDKEKICFKEEKKDENNYEIKYNCLKSEKNKIKNINLVFDNNVTIQLTSDDLLNCAINQNLNLENDEKPEMCEFNIKYNQKISHYSLGLSVFRKFKTYFMINDDSILLEGDNLLNCYLDKDNFNNISRNNKRTIGQTIKELFSTTICIAFIFGLLYGMFYLYEKFYGKMDFIKEEETEKIINRNKYANL